MVILSVCPSRPGTDPRPGEIETGFSPCDSLVSLVPLGEREPTNKEKNEKSTLLKRRYSTAIGSSNVKMVAERHRHAAYHNKHW